MCECRYLFCHNKATARLTVPRHEPRTFICDEHLTEMLEWATPFRTVPGQVIVERLSQ